MRNFKSIARIMAFVLVIVCANEILTLALKPHNYFRIDAHNMQENQYDNIYVGTSHGKAGINPAVLDEITGKKNVNLCLGGQFPIDSYFMVKEICRKYTPEKIIYELDPGYWVTKASLGPDYATVYEEMPLSSVKVEYFREKMLGVDFRTTLFPWYVYRQGFRNVISTFKSRMTSEYRNYDETFYCNEHESYGNNGAVSIHRSETPKTENNLVLWEESKLEQESMEYFGKLVSLCEEKGIELIVITTPIPRETLEKYKDNFEAADAYYEKLMKEKGIVYYNFNNIHIEGFDYSVNGFDDYEGHMYEDQAVVFSENLFDIVK